MLLSFLPTSRERSHRCRRQNECIRLWQQKKLHVAGMLLSFLLASRERSHRCRR
jgi:hypothetical protein